MGGLRCCARGTLTKRLGLLRTSSLGKTSADQQSMAGNSATLWHIWQVLHWAQSPWAEAESPATAGGSVRSVVCADTVAASWHGNGVNEEPELTLTPARAGLVLMEAV